MGDEEAAAAEPVTFSFSKKKRPQNARKRERDDDDGEEPEGSAVVRKVKESKSNPLVQSTAKPKEKDDLTFKSNRTMEAVNVRTDATRVLDIDTDKDMDARALFEKKKALQEQLDKDETGELSKIYRGQAGYREYHKMAENFNEQSVAAKGPVRANAWARVSCRFDYQPDICKDYKETGYCGYGDSCKFMHDRGDYKSGWQQEKEWEEEQKQKGLKAMGLGEEEEEEEKEDELPFACFICRESFTDPVVTKCKHYFCERCALKNFKKTPRCFVCNENTGGLFNVAKDILAKRKKDEEKEAGGGDKANNDQELNPTDLPDHFKQQDFRSKAQAGWTYGGSNTGAL